MIEHTENLTQVHPQAASKLLMRCVAPAPGYLSQTCHASVTNQPFKSFDKELWKLWSNIIGGTGVENDQLAMCLSGQRRSQCWAYVPTRFGGRVFRLGVILQIIPGFALLWLSVPYYVSARVPF